MPEKIPQSTTLRVPIQAYLASDHVSPATGKTLAITLSKNGGAYGNPSGGATNATEISNGSYYVDISTIDSGTLGPLFIKGTSATVDDVVIIYNVVKATNAGFTALPDAVAAASGGLLISGVNAGTMTLGAFTVTGATTYTGPTTFTGLVALSAGLTVNNSTVNGNAVWLIGNGTGSGLRVNGGINGIGVNILGGSSTGNGMVIESAGSHALQLSTGVGGGHALYCLPSGSGAGIRIVTGATAQGISIASGSHGISIATTSGDAILCTPTAGHGLVLTGNGTSKHGLFISGGTAGISDGVHLVAGAGGVQFRGNITGTLDTVTTFTGYTTPPTAAEIAAMIAAGTVAGVTGAVMVDVTQEIPTTNAANTLGDCLHAARVEAFGDETIIGTTWTKKNADLSTAHTFTLDSATDPVMSRTTTP